MILKLMLTGIVGVVALSALAGVLTMEPATPAESVHETEDLDASPTPDPAAAPEPTPAPANRESCSAIRGTAYLSPAERQWFLANCVSR